jgi:hypothetical protein
MGYKESEVKGIIKAKFDSLLGNLIAFTAKLAELASIFIDILKNMFIKMMQTAIEPIINGMNSFKENFITFLSNKIVFNEESFELKFLEDTESIWVSIWNWFTSGVFFWAITSLLFTVFVIKLTCEIAAKTVTIGADTIIAILLSALVMIASGLVLGISEATGLNFKNLLHPVMGDDLFYLEGLIMAISDFCWAITSIIFVHGVPKLLDPDFWGLLLCILGLVLNLFDIFIVDIIGGIFALAGFILTTFIGINDVGIFAPMEEILAGAGLCYSTVDIAIYFVDWSRSGKPPKWNEGYG